MSRTIERQLTIPELSRKGYQLMQEGACSNEADCKGLACKECIYCKDNLDHFIYYFGLLDSAGTITVKEIIKEEGLH